ncbi:MAG: metallophosphoesterase [Clostridia bacterium]|nr:metallophosphoesterase [Clostridia bacterium]NCC44011.1 metallophosphoesterase [Clostridia bacterium]
MILFLIIPIYIVLNLYILHRVHKWLTACSQHFHSKWFVIPYITVYTLLALTLLFAFLLPSSGFQIFVKRLSNYWLGTFIYILMFVAIADILRLILKRTHGKLHDLVFCKVSYVFVGILLTALVASFSVYGAVHANRVQVNPYDVTIKKTCGDMSDLKVVLIADLHLGYSFGNRQMVQMVEKVNQQDADLILVAGDIFDNEYEALQNPDQIAETLSQMKSTYGTYGVFGNHDVTERLLGGFSVSPKEDEVRDSRFDEFAKKSNIQILDDEVACIDDAFYIVGRMDASKPGDGTTNRMTPDEILGDLDKTKPIIVVEHQPKQLQELADAGADMQLAGHTHDGQIFPGNLTIELMWENACGYLKKDDLQSIVTSGVGVWGPAMRVGTDSEICPITIHFENTNNSNK